ncbi:MAG: hypothetical protein JNL82_06915 [Myxococcales bacterium]|nr:hypothetical protein [Myxococcales bacterium]
MRRDDLTPDPPGEDAHDRTAQADEADPDRAAILARRKRFIAIALSGLASGIGCAQPCLSVSRPNEGGEQPVDPHAEPPHPGGGGAPPDACLKVAAPPPNEPEARPEPRPEACLKVATPPSGANEPEPTPCLKVAPPPEKQPEPTPCLKVVPPPEKKPEPTPCLKVRQPQNDPQVPPEACLKIAKPR